MFQNLTTTAVCLAAIICLSASHLHAQQDLSKKQLEHADYDHWNTMSRTSISEDGNWAMFGIQNGAIDGEATITFRSLDSNKQYVIERGSGARFTPDSKFALYRITPSKKKLKQLKKDKAKPADMPKAVFQILELESGAVSYTHLTLPTKRIV